MPIPAASAFKGDKAGKMEGHSCMFALAEREAHRKSNMLELLNQTASFSQDERIMQGLIQLHHIQLRLLHIVCSRFHRPDSRILWARLAQGGAQVLRGSIVMGRWDRLGDTERR